MHRGCGWWLLTESDDCDMLLCRNVFKLICFRFFVQCNMGWDSAVHISSYRDQILLLPRLALGPTQPSVQWVLSLFPVGEVVEV